MAYDEELADRIREQLSGTAYTEKKMFGGLAFLVNGNMSVAASGNGGLLARVPPEDTGQLLAQPGVDVMDMGRGPMKGWLRVADDALASDAALAAWVALCVGYATTLPPKGSRPKPGAVRA